MDKLFADTGYWIALLNPRDELHDRARILSRDLSARLIVTTEMILTEFLNCFSDYGGLRLAAATAAASLLNSSQINVIPQTSELFTRALEFYLDVDDKNWSLTDCASFLVMKDHALSAALTYDHHFVQAGFQALLR